MFEYILREIFLSVIAFLAGAGVSAGVFAFVLVIGVVPRILRCSRIENIILIENIKGDKNAKDIYYFNTYRNSTF